MSVSPKAEGGDAQTDTFLGVPPSGAGPRMRRRSRSASLEERRGRSRRSSHGQSSSHSEHDEEVHDHWHTDKPHQHYGPKMRTWHQRPTSPGLRWHKQLTPQGVKTGRVLLIDYVRQDLSKVGTRKVSAQEIHDIGALCRLYAGKRRDEAVLRVFHVQNAEWAEQYLFKKFNIADRNDLVDSDFAKFVFWKHPAKARTRMPLLTGKSWQTQHDPWRGISKTAFGMDYLKSYKVQDPEHQIETDPAGKMLELNCYDEVTEDPRYGYDVYGQRISVYVQHKESTPQPPPKVEGIRNPYEDTNGTKEKSENYFPVLDSLDNGNAILIFENSKSESIEDTLIKARGKWESRWRRLPFYLAYDSLNTDDDDETAFLCARTICSDIWRALAQQWGRFLSKSGRHVEILEQKIYERPADESRADEIWRNSSSWLRCERLAYVHQNLLEEVGNNLHELNDDDSSTEDAWLKNNAPDFQRISNLVQEDLVKPTANLSDLMYKSVGIRDTRHSLELSYSMWRLSWITFIFLPLTFTVGFFGMNVNTFSEDPPLFWFFVGAVPLMIIVLVSWYFLKWALTASSRDPYSRGVYERLYHDLAVQYPALWTRGGPAHGTPDAAPRDARMKWYLIQRWNDPEKTIKARNQRTYNEDDQFDGLGFWSRAKRSLTRRWTAEINAVTTKHREIEKGGPATGHAVREGVEVVQQALNLSVPGAAKNADVLHLPDQVNAKRYSLPSNAKENAAEVLAAAAAGNASAPGLPDSQDEPVPTDLDHRIANLHPIGTPPSSGRQSSPGAASRNSGVMIEEREPEKEDQERRQSDDLAVNRFPGLRSA